MNGLILDLIFKPNIRSRAPAKKCSFTSILLNSKLAAGMISETINIADAIRAAKVSTSLHHLESPDKNLKAFEGLGLEVGFLRARLYELVSLSREYPE